MERGWFIVAVMACGTQALAVDFSREILPILSNKCFVCHGPDTKKKDLVRLDSFAGATRDLGGYAAINPKQSGESEIIARLHDTEEPMPPKDAEKQLTDAERELLTQWVKEGGKYAKHWAFVPPKKHRPDWTGNAIDALVGRQLKAKGTDFAPTADKPTLARRAALVLTGLPPESVLLKQFLADKKPGAYERLVDALLTSPHYGEHQARYWLDAVRYGDTHGLHLDNKRAIYPYRDWVVRAFNRNQPLDQFLIWQLAGDMLPEPTLEQQVATGFVRMNPTTAEGGAIPAEFQAKNNFDRVETVGTALLGMSLVCARCHTHKYDPIPQVEYYQMMAFFNSTAEPSMDGNRYEYGPAVKAPADVAAWDRWESLKKKGEAGAKELAEFQKTFKPTLVAKELPKPRETKLLERGEYNLPKGEPLQPGVFGVMSEFPKDAPRNRLGLAQWLTARGHPLVSRVLVNRIWQRTFGEGLVRTPADFGLQGEQPTHPVLLDWLAVDLQDRKWNLKAMLKQMVMSRTFQQSSARRAQVNDPENRLWARGPSFRLDAESLRDVALWSSGLLESAMGGEGVKPYQPAGLWKALMHPASNTKNYVADKDARQYRRSLYVYWKRTSPHPMMTLFDAPSRESSCVRRSRTSTPTQSLALLNERQRVEMGRRFGQRLLLNAKDDVSRLNILFELVASRAPNAAERKACMDLFKTLKTRYGANEKDAQAFLSVGDSPRDEKLNAAEHAAWAQVAITVLASDITMWIY